MLKQYLLIDVINNCDHKIINIEDVFTLNNIITSRIQISYIYNIINENLFSKISNETNYGFSLFSCHYEVCICLRNEII